jgi:hypothetical protein
MVVETGIVRAQVECNLVANFCFILPIQCVLTTGFFETPF